MDRLTDLGGNHTFYIVKESKKESIGTTATVGRSVGRSAANCRDLADDGAS